MSATDWVTIADLATAGGTTALAVATFFSTRSAMMAARSAERGLLEGLRPILVPSGWTDPVQKVHFLDERWVAVRGGHAALEMGEDAAYLVLSLRNAGRGMAVLHGCNSTASPAISTLPPVREGSARRRCGIRTARSSGTCATASPAASRSGSTCCTAMSKAVSG
jgi:hypothetical protein